MAGTIRSTTAWRARPLLVQWVMCKPAAIGSRHAKVTIWPRCRGGNLLRPAHAGLVQQERLQAALLVAATDPPDGAGMTLQALGYGADGFTSGNGQDDAGM